MKILGVDFGTKKIGLAIAESGLVEPLTVVSFSKRASQIRQIGRIGLICRGEAIDKIVVGVSEGKSAVRAKKFGQNLARLTGLPVEFVDETLTTHNALVKMKTVSKRWQGKPDAIAAALILENYVKKYYRSSSGLAVV